MLQRPSPTSTNSQIGDLHPQVHTHSHTSFTRFHHARSHSPTVALTLSRSLSLSSLRVELWTDSVKNPGSVALATNSRIAPLKPERADYNYGFGATVDIPLETSSVCMELW
ncbi:hypothetical protein RIF29_09986 [Crotalaria pallida]|uniref:Uncharacterized protein n=1 Tax=Crotalaria pallida TaxID=3830 RepID=A0AAN9ILP7_CROPI